MRKVAYMFVVGIAVLALVVPAVAQPDPTARLDQLSTRVSRLESRVEGSAGAVVVVLFGAFCALWAQNTKRNPWLWFLLGVIFNVITVFALLAKNADDLKAARGAPARGSAGTILAIALGVLLIVVFILLWLRVRGNHELRADTALHTTAAVLTLRGRR